MALGADAGKVRLMVLRQVGMMTIAGTLIGIAVALAVGRGAKALLFQMAGNDPLVVIAAAAVLAIVALSAGYLPALRASKIDPMQALRYE
jgi:putative ABC transport system permease protein